MNIAETIYQHVKAFSQDQALEVLHFVEFLETKKLTKANPLPNEAQNEAGQDFFNEAGIWQNRDIDQETIRTRAWRNDTK